MSATIQLCPSETVALLAIGNKQAIKHTDAVKAEIAVFLAQGVLKIEETVASGRWKSKKAVQSIKLTQKPAAHISGSSKELLNYLAPIGKDGVNIKKFVGILTRSLGSSMFKFTDKHIIPALENRNLIEQRSRKVLWIFNIKTHHLTDSGRNEEEKLKSLFEKAKNIPAFIDSDPAQVVALAASLGTNIFIINELRPYLSQIFPLFVKNSTSTDSIFSIDAGSSTGLMDFDLSIFETIDLSVFDSIDSTLSSFDASFDSSSGADGGGSDAGGGDGSGGGD